jgi:hypothetical protein
MMSAIFSLTRLIFMLKPLKKTLTRQFNKR